MVINRVKDLLAGRRGGLWGAKSAAPAPARDVPRAPAADTNVPPAAPAPAVAAQSSTSASLEDYFDRLDAAFASVEAATEARTAPVLIPDAPAGAVAAGSQSAASAGLAAHEFAGWDPDLAGDPLRTEPAEVPVADAPVPALAAPVSTPAAMAEAHTAAPIVPTLPVPAPPRMPYPADDAPSATASVPAAVAETPVIPFKSTPPREPEAAVLPPATAAAPPPPANAPVIVPTKIDKPVPAAATPSPVVGPSRNAVVPSLAEAFASLLSAERGRPITASAIGAAAPISDEKIEEIVRRVVASMADRTIRDTVIDVAERLVREEIDRIKEGR